MTTYSIDAQITEIEREIAMRISVYSRQIASGKMRRSVADYHTDCMRAVLATLQQAKAGKPEAFLGGVAEGTFATVERCAQELEAAYAECSTLNLLHGAARLRALYAEKKK